MFALCSNVRKHACSFVMNCLLSRINYNPVWTNDKLAQSKSSYWNKMAPSVQSLSAIWPRFPWQRKLGFSLRTRRDGAVITQPWRRSHPTATASILFSHQLYPRCQQAWLYSNEARLIHLSWTQALTSTKQHRIHFFLYTEMKVCEGSKWKWFGFVFTSFLTLFEPCERFKPNRKMRSESLLWIMQCLF